MINDKEKEYLRYDRRAQSLLRSGVSILASPSTLGSSAISPIFRAPYNYYERSIKRYVSRDHDVLELCSGAGLHTYVLIQAGARVVATDISKKCLEVLARRMDGSVVETRVADMESLPFRAKCFDVVSIAGGLSYGDPALVDAEIRRVLRPGGIFICVDSLNHNPIYRVNRWFQYMRGARTKSTLLHMPTMARIRSISRGFASTEVRFFGAVSYLMVPLGLMIGQARAANFSDAADRMVRVRWSAFKFVMVAKGRL